MKKIHCFICLFIFSAVSLKAQVRYVVDSTVRYWPGGIKKQFSKSFTSFQRSEKYVYRLEYYKNGLLKTKELLYIDMILEDTIRIKNTWDSKSVLLSKNSLVQYMEYRWKAASDSILVQTQDFTSKIRYNEEQISKVPLEGFVKIKGGEFKNFNAAYPVCSSAYVNGFYLQETEVTNEQYRAFIEVMLKDSVEMYGLEYINTQLKPNDSAVEEVEIEGEKIKFSTYLNDPKYNQYPVTAIDWWAAQMYCNWVAKKLQQEYPELKYLIEVRLPTELEWEYAATEGRGMKEYLPAEKEFIVAHSNFNSSSDPYPFTSPVKSFNPNKYGLYDMMGNVKEWCGDAYYDPLLKSKDSLLLYDPWSWSLYNCYFNSEEPRKIIRGGSFATPTIAKGLRDYHFQDSTTYFDETNFTTQKKLEHHSDFNKMAYHRIYTLKTPSKPLPPDMGFRVVIELYDPSAVRKYLVGGELEEF